MLTIGSSNVYFSSDFHFSHQNICRGVTRWDKSDPAVLELATRDFQTLEDMNSTLVGNINSTVGPDDTLFFLGDWSFGGFGRVTEFSSLLHCQNIHFVLGNHDHHIEVNRELCQSRFLSVSNYLHLKVEDSGQEIILSHYPFATWNNLRRGAWHLYGHLHRKGNAVLGPGKTMDVGIDGHPDFRPYSFQEVSDLMKGLPIISHYQDLS